VLINLGASIGATVVAEGVETEEQLRALTAMHCPLYQGFYFSRPVDPDRLGSMLTSRGQTVMATPA
jgi:c-di-GMP-specific phosphodiesterase